VIFSYENMKTNTKQISFVDLGLRKIKITRTETFLQRALQIIDFSFTKKLHLELHNLNKVRRLYDTTILFN